MRNRVFRSVCLGLALFSSIVGAQEVQNWGAPPYWVPGAAAASPSGRSTKSLESAAAVGGALAFHSLTPCRVIDTRGNGFAGQYGPPSLPAFSPRNFAIGGQCGVPVAAAAVSFNFAVTSLSTNGNLIVYPQGGSVPTTSSLNWDPAEVAISNAAVIGLGVSSGIGVSVNGPSNAGSVDLIVDVNGYYFADPSVTTLNSLSGDVVLAAGTNVTLTPIGQTLTLSTSVPAGPPGPVGPTGTAGATGPAGPAGPAGSIGPVGPIGPVGAIGPAGPQGTTGTAGPSGPQGPQGVAGQTGTPGAKGLQWQSAWDGVATFAKDDAVRFGGSSYISLVAGNTGHQPDTSPAEWSLLAQQGNAGATGATGAAGPQGPLGATGPIGPQGPGGAAGLTGATGPQGPVGTAGATGAKGVSWQGVWSNATSYASDDAVSFNGSSYISLANANVNQPPASSPAFWSLLAQEGAAGALGPQGSVGATGALGPQGPVGATGGTGAIGPQGPVGSTGAAGATGPQGPVGSTGAIGPQGPAGGTGAKGLSWQGAWSNTTAYAFDDAVSFNGSSYVSLASANVGQLPASSPASWGLLAQEGGTGAVGPQGPSGADGSTGATGGIGPQGPVGATGAFGPQGPVGATGATGTSGAVGPQGPAGATGSKGLSWLGAWSSATSYAADDAVSFSGSSYVSLANANVGQPPATSPASWSVIAQEGATGAIGPQGTAGVDGAAGATGATGTTGPIGPQGPVGSTGAIGPQGPVGTTGAIGPQGPVGSAGAIGPQGPVGATGALGPQGPIGVTGAVGPQGPIGVAGAKGLSWQGAWNNGTTYASDDAVVFNGSTYISLANGNVGQSPAVSPTSWSLVAQEGATGATGAVGPQGLTGADGAMGATGATGGIGPQGPVGSTGATGAIGPQGATGTTGATGAMGAIGPQGSVGATGATGAVGAPGATGPAGAVGMNWRNVWSAATTYAIRDAVDYNGSTYLCVAASTNNQPDISAAFWNLVAQAGATGSTGATGPQGTAGANGATGATGALGPQGPVGSTGAVGPQGSVGATGAAGATGATGATGAVGMNWRNVWSAATAYAIRDAVDYNGSTYVCVAASTNNQPDISAAFWNLVAQKGAIGTTGATGSTGATGPQGTAGANGATGATGAVGPQGPLGATGATGAAGATGAVGMNWRNVWSAATAYAIRDAVDYSGSTYVCVAASTNNQPDISAAFWNLVAQKGATGATGSTGAVGPQGPVGATGAAGATGSAGATGPAGATGAVGMNWRNVWSAATVYAIRDAVVYSGSTYVCVAASTNNQPDISAAFWNLVAQKGAAGTNGTNGATGAAGPTGPTGPQGPTGAAGVAAKGSGALVGGSATISNASATATSVIMLTYATPTAALIGPLIITSQGAGTFNVGAWNGSTQGFYYVIFNP